MPASVADYFGSRNVGPIYGLMLTAWGIAAVCLWSTLAVLTRSVSRVPPFELTALSFGVAALLYLVKWRIGRVDARAILAAVPARAWALGVGGLFGFVLPIWAILAAMGLVIPNAPAVALSRHPDAAGTAAALLGAAQFGLGAAVAPLVGVLGNGEIALALVMTVGMVIALLALLAVGVPAAETEDDVTGDAVAEAA